MNTLQHATKWILTTVFILLSSELNAFNLVETIKQVKPSVVGIGIYTPIGRQKHQLTGTGFAILKGNHVVTNHHVVPPTLDDSLLQEFVVYVGTGRKPDIRKARVVASSDYHDLAILEVEGAPIKPLTLSDDEYLEEGEEIAFTGFPIGAILGLYPVTHRGIISTVSPVVIPTDSASRLSLKMLKRLKNPYLIYQLDATAYPGNSGSAVYDAKTGMVIGVINKVLVKESKESVIEKPSGITYAIPVKHVHELIDSAKLK